MAITVWRYGLCYFPAPKTANTTIKHALHEVKTGQSFQSEMMPDGSRKHIHNVYKTPKFSSVNHEKVRNLLRFAVIRDPIERLLSAWSNRVVYHGELSEKKTSAEVIRDRELVLNPSLPEFIERLEDYRAIKGSIRVHTDPLVDFLGMDAAYYHLLFDIRGLPSLARFLGIMTGREVTLRRLQTGGPKVTRADLTHEQVRRLEAFYVEDYNMFGDALARSAAGAAGVAKGVSDPAVEKIAGGGQ